MRKNWIVLLGCCMLYQSSCTDNNYDLSDIDTTTSIKVDHLTVPVKFGDITLDQVLDMDNDNPDNPIKTFEDSNGKSYYAIEVKGDFMADDIFVEEFEATQPATTDNLPIDNIDGKIKNLITQFSYSVNDVDPSLVKLYHLGLKESNPIQIQLSLEGNKGSIDEVVVIIPENFTAFFDGKEVLGNKVYLGSLAAGEISEPIFVYSIDFADGLTPFNGKMEFHGEIGIESAVVKGEGRGNTVNFLMSPFKVTTISGSIDYEIEAPEFESVSLDGLPDFLKDGESNLVIENPQIYLNFENPLGAPFLTTLQIEPKGNDGKKITKNLSPFVTSIVLAGDTKNLNKSEGEGAVIEEWKDLRYVLAGNGLPDSIDFKLESTYLRGEVINLKLGDYMQVGGNYSFFSPLAFGEGSKILYQKSEKDFFGDDVKDVKISYFQITTLPETNLPLSVELTIYPLDNSGNRILDDNGNYIEANGKVDPYADGRTPLELKNNQNFNGLDGIEYVVTVDDLQGETLRPDQFIRLKDIKAVISGEYITKF